ncbi:MAG: efflux RND transporter periplasmic adaptor subunit [Lentisphaerae bacterium]|nr:efflux RND transporter periplasmic adaptor subunit [Lentisphaerota bacterium]
MKKTIILFLFAAAAGATEAAAPVPVVKTSKVLTVEKTAPRRYAGLVEAVEKVDIMPRVTGELRKIHFKEGEIVQKGSLLFELEDTTYQAAVDALAARREQLLSQVDFMTREYTRNQELIAKKAVSESVYDRSLFDLNSAKAQLKEVEASLINARNDLSYTKIYAPITGRIGKSTFTVGNLITPNGKKLADIAMVSPINVRFAISETVLRKEFKSREGIMKNGSVSIKLSDSSIHPETCGITLVDNHINSTTNTVTLWAKFQNRDNLLIPGGYVTVYLNQSSGKFTAVLPSALVLSEKGTGIYVIKKGRAVFREVVTGGLAGELQIIKSGVSAGEEVVIEGSHKLQDGMTVRTANHE